jgi:hypothetical protein
MCNDPNAKGSHREIRGWISQIRNAAALAEHRLPLTKEGAARLHDVATKAEKLLERIEARDSIAS